MGMARTTPSAARKKVHAASTGQESWVPLGFSGVTERRSMAGTAEMMVLPVE